MSWQETEDWHTAGEPFRVVSKLPPNCLEPNVSVAEQRRRIIADPDHPLDKLRQSLCHEPRGHADMYGGFLVPPNDAGAHLGVLFWHKDGFSTTCGHGTIALAYYALCNGVVKLPDSGVVDVIIDVPSGRVVGHATCQTGRVLHVDFVNVESYQVKANLPLTIAMSQHTQQIPALRPRRYKSKPASVLEEDECVVLQVLFDVHRHSDFEFKGRTCEKTVVRVGSVAFLPCC